MKLDAISGVVFVVVSVLTGAADAAVTAWTNPVIAGATGSGVATPSIAENTAAGALSVTIAATIAAAGTAAYAITAQATTGKITINSATGVLTLASGTFDFETEPAYELTITCTDSSDSAVGTATVTLSITDVGPTFAKSQYSITIPDGSTAGTSLISVSATGGTIAYSITDGNTPAHWKVDSNTGKITVNDGITLAQATLGGYSLTITATDGGGETATTKVWIAVTTCSGVAAIISSGLMMFVVLATQLL